VSDEKRNQMTEKGNEENLSNVNQTEPVNFKEKDLINQINDLKNDITFLLQDNEEKDRKIKRYKSIIIELENQINIIKNGNEKELYELMKNESNKLRKELDKKDSEISNLITERDGISKEKKRISSKLEKMRNNIIQISKQFESQLAYKEKKSKFVNDCNSKLFMDLNNKNKILIDEIKKLNEINNKLKQEKFELENICLMQEQKIQHYENRYILSKNRGRSLLKSKGISISQKYLFPINPLKENIISTVTYLKPSSKNPCSSTLSSLKDERLPTIK
jgi:chromosome segregation ATPase